MTKQATFVIDLLRAVHGRASLSRDLTPRQLDYLVSAGLGPAARDACVQADQAVPETLASANLTARVICNQMRRATVDLLRCANEAGLEPILLKGISIADELYRQPHTRIMGDVDVLLPAPEARRLHERLLTRGFAALDEEVAATTTADHHHLPELRQEATGVPIEIHTGLISRTRYAADPLLQPSVFFEAVRDASFDGLRCRRFSLEYQIVHTLMHWAIDHKWTINVISINDFVHLTNATDPTLDWRRLAGWMRESPSFADVYAVLAIYLEAAGLIRLPAELAGEVEVARRRLGAVNLRVLHWLLHTFPLSGRRKVGWVLTPLNVRVLWLTLLEPRHKSLRLLVAAYRIVFRRTPGQSLVGSLVGRIRTLLQPNV